MVMNRNLSSWNLSWWCESQLRHLLHGWQGHANKPLWAGVPARPPVAWALLERINCWRVFQMARKLRFLLFIVLALSLAPTTPGKAQSGLPVDVPRQDTF